MRRRGITRRMAVTAICLGAALAPPSAAMAALTTHSATDTTANSAGQFVATAKCGAGEHVVSGGWKSLAGDREGAAVLSRAVRGDGWTVHLFPDTADKLTTYAYCSSKRGVSQHAAEVSAKRGPRNTVARAHCASGQTLVAGGYAFLGTPSALGNSPTFKNYVVASKWTVMAAFDTIPANLMAFAYCQKDVTVTVRSATSAPIHRPHDGSATASCRKGETLLSGGYTTVPRPDWGNVKGPDFFYFASYRSGSRSWTASAHNYGKPGMIKVFAYCQP
jgi:hypothetical protein